MDIETGPVQIATQELRRVLIDINNMNIKTIVIGVIVLILLGIGTAFVLFRGWQGGEVPGNGQGTGTPSSTTTGGVTPGGTGGTTGGTNTGTLSIKLLTGKEVTVGNFLKDPATIEDPSNQGYYFVGYHPPFGTVPVAQNAPYYIAYIAETQYFNVILNAEPLSESRKQAEQYLMNKLGLTAAEMCSLNYTLSVPGFVNEQYSGSSLDFSFCPGAVALP